MEHTFYLPAWQGGSACPGGMGWPLTLGRRDGLQFISHLGSQPREGAAAWHAGPQAVDGRLCSTERVGCSLVPAGGRDWLVGMILWAGRGLDPRLRE